jgi:hypothetical protein
MLLNLSISNYRSALPDAVHAILDHMRACLGGKTSKGRGDSLLFTTPHNVNLNKDHLFEFSWKMWQMGFRAYFVGSMPPLNMERQGDNMFNLCVQPAKSDLVAWRAAVNTLQTAMEACIEISKGNVTEHSRKWMGDFTAAMMQLDEIKGKALVPLIVKRLKNDPNCKVIVFVNYLDSTDNLRECLEKALGDEKVPATIGVINSREDKCGRSGVINRFRNDDMDWTLGENNATSSNRVLLASLAIASVALSLDDTTGIHKRYSYILPNYKTIDVVQAARRTLRATTKGVPEVRVVYCADNGGVGEREMGLLACTYEKSRVLEFNRGKATSDAFTLPARWKVKVLDKNLEEGDAQEPKLISAFERDGLVYIHLRSNYGL